MADERHSLSSYPLSWPDGWPRTGASHQKSAKFLKNGNWLTISDAIQRVLCELQRIGVHRDDVIISTNVPTRLDGMPRSNMPEPSDKGVAVYWRKGRNAPMQCMAIDIYNLTADNLAAVAATIEAMRAIERHGGASVQERAFRGFAALPSSTQRPWREVLNLGTSATRDSVEAQFRLLAKTRHPDAPNGSHDAMAELNAAREQAIKELA